MTNADAEALVFIPGLNCTRELFADQIGRFEGERKIIVADTMSDASIGGMADRLLAAAPSRFALLGLSMGGYVALEVMRRAAARVSRLALLDTSAAADDAQATERRLKLISFAQDGRFNDVHKFLWQKLVHQDRWNDAELESRVRGMMVETGAERFVNQQRAIMSRIDSHATLPFIQVPTLVLVGAQDTITPPPLAQRMSEAIPRSDLVVVDNCGHLSTMERPGEVNAALAGWLAR